MSQARKSSIPRTVWSLCRQWRQENLRAQFEVSMLDEGDDDGVNRIVSAADASMKKLEAQIVEAAPFIEDLDEAQATLSIALAIMRENAVNTGRAEAILRGVHCGMNSIRNAFGKRAVA